jgi:hypothetical protein
LVALALAVAGVIDDAIATVVALLGEAAWSSIFVVVVVVVVVDMEVVEMQAWVVRWSRPIHSRLY